jgi:chromosome partitioning protein
MLMDTVARVRKALFPKLKVRGILLTMYDNRTNLSQEVVDEVRSHFGDQVFQSIIPRSVRLAEAPSHGLPILAYFPNSPGADAHRALAEEVLQQDGVKIPVEA